MRKILPDFIYYKVVRGEMRRINVPIHTFLNAYIELLVKNKYMYEQFNKENTGFLNNTGNLQQRHDEFITSLFDETSYIE
jgi:hypothetical protein